ncbi:thiazole synthase [Lentisphaerota bacterium ZTH]|nr:thiazole synthase [Lentisphaerota bacterium]WET05171.1 thiazole synthase [Lentisphaerota bacterium ZTH]
MNDLKIADHIFKNRLFLGTGKFSSKKALEAALEASETELVTMAMTRIDLDNAQSDNILSAIDHDKIKVMLNTSGARDAAEAVRIAHLGRSAGYNWIKLEIHPDPTYLLPDPIETFKAAETLVKDGFIVLPYINADPVLAKRLEDVGVHAVMPLGSPIGSNQGLQTECMLRIIIEQACVPVVIDAGIGVPSHATQALEMGADAVLVNTAIATAENPAMMAEAFKIATATGTMTRTAGAAAATTAANASSPMASFSMDIFAEGTV